MVEDREEVSPSPLAPEDAEQPIKESDTASRRRRRQRRKLLDPRYSLRKEVSDDLPSLIARLRANGLFQIFEQAVSRQMTHSAPRRGMERHLAAVIHMSTPRPVPPEIRRRIRVSAGTRVDYIVGQGIGIVLVDGQINDFVVAKEIARLEAQHRLWPRKGEGKPRGKREPLRDPQDPFRIGSSWVAFTGHMSAELQMIHTKRSREKG